MLPSLRSRLCAIYFLEYLIRGAWQPVLALYTGTKFLNFSGFQQAWIFNAFAIAMITGMFFGGQLADRIISRRRFMALSHLISGLAVLALAYVKTFWPFFGFMLLHCFFYVPTMSVSNALVFAHVENPKRDFGIVRLWGSVGWIAAAWPLIFIPIDWAKVPAIGEPGGFISWLGVALKTLKTGPAMEAALADTYIVAAIASFALAILCLVGLPESEPPVKESESFAPWKAIQLLARPVVLVLFIATFLDSVIHNGYYFWTSQFFPTIGLPVNWIAPAMSIGQAMEVVTMIFLGRIIARLGWRNTLIVGVLAQAIRFGVYALGSTTTLPLVIAVNLIHGLAYACFFATVYIIVDQEFPKDIRASAQGLFNLMMFGLSQFVGSFLWGWLRGVFSTKQLVAGKVVDVINFQQIFLIPFALSLFTALFLAVFFRPHESGIETTPESPKRVSDTSAVAAE